MSGLSAFLKSTYLLYKEATDTSLSWIAGKAKAMGYPLDNGVIGTKGIVECAQWIAEHGEQSTVSYSFAVALNYAITIRTIHGKEVSGVDLKSDERHQHFIDILRRVRKTLSSVMGPKVAQAAGIQVDPAITLSSQFAQLEVEEPSEQFLRAPDVSLPLIKNRFEIERDPLEEALFAIELILEDYKSFRTVIRECWQEYHEGTRDLIEISVMTNTAIDLARRLEADAKDLFDECGGFTTVFQKYCESSANDAPSADRVSEKQGPFNVYELAEPFLGSTFSILEDFLRSIQDGPLPDTKVAREGPGALPILPESHPFDPAIAEAKRKADEAFLHAMLLDFYVVTTKMKPILPEDELTRGLRTVYETKELSLWVIFALQVYLDINYIFHDEVARGYWDFRKYAWSIYDSINRNFGLFQSIRCDPWPYEKDEALAKIRTDLERIVDEDLVRQRKSQLGFSGAVLGSDHQYWKSHPVRCGLMAYNTRMRFQELSVEFESKWQTIYYTYFLYYALRVQNLLRAPWEDMEALIKAQPQIDLSDRAKTLQDVVMRVGTDLGVSARWQARTDGEVRRYLSSTSALRISGFGKEIRLRLCSRSASATMTAEQISRRRTW